MFKSKILFLLVLFSLMLASCENNIHKSEENINSDPEIVDVFLNEDGFYYSLNNNTVSIRGIEDSNNLIRIIIPEEINGKKVTEIGEEAFRDNQNIVEVVLPDTIEVLGDSCFRNCKQLTTVNLPEGLKEIQYSFGGCYRLSSILIPSTLESGKGAFSGCSNLTKVEFAENATYVPCFYSCFNLKEIELPDTIKIIEDYAFEETSIEKIKIPAGLEVMGRDCFVSTNLESLEIPEGMTEVPERFFSGPIKEAVIPASVKKLGQYLFEGCEAIEKVTINCDLPESIKKNTDDGSPFEKFGYLYSKQYKENPIEIIFGPEVKTVTTKFDIIPKSVDFGNVEEIGFGVLKLNTPETAYETYTLPASLKKVNGLEVYALKYIFDHDFEIRKVDPSDYHITDYNLINNPYDTFVEKHKEWDPYYEDWYEAETVTHEYKEITIEFTEGISEVPDGLLGRFDYIDWGRITITDFEDIEKYSDNENAIIKKIIFPPKFNKPFVIAGYQIKDCNFFKQDMQTTVYFSGCYFSEDIVLNEGNKNNYYFQSCKIGTLDINDGCEGISIEKCYIDELNLNAPITRKGGYKNTLVNESVINTVSIIKGGTLSYDFSYSKIKNMKLTDEVTHLDAYFADNCLFENDIDCTNIVCIDDHGFVYCYGDVKVKFGEHPIIFGSNAFSRAKLIPEFNGPVGFLPESVGVFVENEYITETPAFVEGTVLPRGCFYKCTNLKTVNLNGLGCNPFNSELNFKDCPIDSFIVRGGIKINRDGLFYGSIDIDGNFFSLSKVREYVELQDLNSILIYVFQASEEVKIPFYVVSLYNNVFQTFSVKKAIFNGVCDIKSNAFDEKELIEIETHGDTKWFFNDYSDVEKMKNVKILRIYPEVSWESNPDSSIQYFLPQGYVNSEIINFLEPEEIHYYLYEKQEVPTGWFYGDENNEGHSINSNAKIYIHCTSDEENPDATYAKQKAFYENPENGISTYKAQFIYVLPDETEIPYSEA